MKESTSSSQNESLPMGMISDEFVENLTAVAPQEILEALLKIQIQTWNYIGDDENIRHMGPMAQDFYAAFGVGSDDKTIYHIDAVSVCLASIQALYGIIQEQATQINDLQERIDQQTNQLDVLAKYIEQLKNK